jgi:hypothetical protein
MSWHAAAAVERIVFAISLVLLLFTAAGGPGWTDASSHAVLATYLERTATSPLYGVVSGVAAYLPVGEPGFRLAVLGALLGAVTLAGVIRAARALLPKDPIAGLAGAALLLLAPPFRDASAFADPAILVACGLVWTVAFAIEHARDKDARKAAAALACAAIVVGSAPWLGMPVLVAVGIYLSRAGASRTLLILSVGAIGMLTVILWLGALGRMPDPGARFTAFVATSGRAAVLVGVGLLAVLFGAATKLAHAAWLAIVIALVVVHAIFIDPDATPVLALFAVAAAVLPSAVVRVLPAHRHVVAAVAGVPLVGAALLAGAGLRVDDPGDAPARLATDLIDEVPPGPGVFIATRPTTQVALEYAQLVAGARPDLTLSPPAAPTDADVFVKQALVTDRIAASDAFAFGRLDPKRAYPRGRGFQLLATEPTKLAAIRPPAKYPSAIGESESVLLALSLTRYEAGFGRLDAAAHAAGLARTRFGAADLALLATAQPIRPPLYGMIPSFGTPVGPWLLDLLGDDLAWVAGVDQPDVDAPPARRLHTLWRKLLTGQIKVGDPAIVALGPEAVAATAALVEPPPPPKQ